jgi:hypothetical protein
MFTDRAGLISIARAVATASTMAALLAPQPALAQQADQWEVTVAPFCPWATKIDGDLTARSTTVPVFLSFSTRPRT